MHVFHTNQVNRMDLLRYFQSGPAWIHKLVWHSTIDIYATGHVPPIKTEVFMYFRPQDVFESRCGNWRDVEHIFRDAICQLLGHFDLSLFRMLPYPSEDNEEYGEAVGLNQCWFKTETTIEHDDLRFRSPAEVAIYDDLSTRKLLFFPNAAAILGGGKRETREPDFLICLEGRWGILEVMGETYHTPTNAVKDHERARLFKKYGVLCMEFFPAIECNNSPKNVVDRFLTILSKHT